MEIPIPTPNKPDIFSYGFDRYLNKLREIKSDNSVIYNTSNPTSASNIVFGALNIGSGTSVFGVEPSQGLWLGAEKFENAPFRVNMGGDLTANKINIGNYQRIVDTDENIQDAVNELTSTGGLIILKSGIYNVNYNIILPSNVSIKGAGIENTVINFGSGAYSIKMEGTQGYHGGTASINLTGTTVSGIGTTWSTNLVAGQNIRLGDFWYPILSVNGDTTLTISTPYLDRNISFSSSYDTCSFCENNVLQEFTVTGSSGDGILIDYGYNILIERLISISNGGNGITLKNGSYCGFNIIYTVANGVHGLYAKRWDHGVIGVLGIGYWYNGSSGLKADEVFSTGFGITESKGNLYGATFGTCYGCALLNQEYYFNYHGAVVENSEGVHFAATLTDFNSSCGIIVKDSSAFNFLGGSFSNNGNDGCQLSSNCDKSNISSTIVHDNSGYGINILSPTNDNIVLSGINYDNNTSGKFNDLGTNTLNDLITMQSITTTTAYTISTPNYLVIYNLTSGTETTMPSATGSGRVYHLKNIGIGDITISASTGELIDGQGSQVMPQWDSLGLMDYASGSWVII